MNEKDQNLEIVEDLKTSGTQLLVQGDFDKAIELFEKAIVLEKKDNTLFHLQGNCFLNLKKYDQAKKCFMKSVEINPNFYRSVNNLGVIHYEKNELIPSFENFQNAWNMCKDLEEESDIVKSSISYNMGNSKKENGEYNEAIGHFSRAIRLNPIHYEALYRRIICYMKVGSYAKCEEEILNLLSSSIEVKKHDQLSLYLKLGKCQHELSDYEKSIDSYTKSIEFYEDCECCDPYFVRSYMYEKVDETEKALEDISKHIELNVENPRMVPFYNRGIYHKKLGRNELALEDFEKALQCNSEDVYTNYHVAHLLFIFGKNDQRALKLLQNLVLNLNPGYERGKSLKKQVESRIAKNNVVERVEILKESINDEHRDNGYFKVSFKCIKFSLSEKGSDLIVFSSLLYVTL